MPGFNTWEEENQLIEDTVSDNGTPQGKGKDSQEKEETNIDWSSSQVSAEWVQWETAEMLVHECKESGQ